MPFLLVFLKLSSELDWSLCQADSGPQALCLTPMNEWMNEWIWGLRISENWITNERCKPVALAQNERCDYEPAGSTLFWATLCLTLIIAPFTEPSRFNILTRFIRFIRIHKALLQQNSIVSPPSIPFSSLLIFEVCLKSHLMAHTKS